MRRSRVPGGHRVVSFRVVPVLLAACIGYLLGSAHIDAFRAASLSAADAIALRFPQNVTQDWRNASRTAATAFRAAAKLAATRSDIVAGVVEAGSDTELALLDPTPMAPQVSASADPDPAPPATVQTAAADASEPLSMPAINSQPPALPVARKPVQSPAAAVTMPTVKVAAVVPRHASSERPGYILNDAQIASIKQRLHLTPDQEQMWPAVEAALRNMAYTHSPRTRGRGETQTAAVDPNAVQGLKSAAVPLIMSFNAEQKEEVRNLVHVMGLDQLASEL